MYKRGRAGNLASGGKQYVGYQSTRRDSCAVHMWASSNIRPHYVHRLVAVAIARDGTILYLFPVCSSFVCFRAAASTGRQQAVQLVHSAMLQQPKIWELLYDGPCILAIFC